MEGFFVWRPSCLWPGGCPFLHSAKDHHLTLANQHRFGSGVRDPDNELANASPGLRKMAAAAYDGDDLLEAFDLVPQVLASRD